MKKYFYLLCFFVGLNSCNTSEECIADIAVTALDAPAAIISGNVIKIVCVIKNLAQTAIECSSSDSGSVTVTCGYSPSYHENFSSYEVFDQEVYSLSDSIYIKRQVDIMEMPTNMGPGYYAMKVEVDSPIDEESDNDGSAVAIRAD